MVSVSAIFVAFLIWKVRRSVATRDPLREPGRERLKAARRRIREAGKDRAALEDALREAALIALDELKRPELAARFARRADTFSPGSGASVETVVRTMRAAGRYPALERLLWRKLDAAEPGTERHDRIFEALLDLYDGPLNRPYQAAALRRLRAGTESGG
jgi:hypothetical protein